MMCLGFFFGIMYICLMHLKHQLAPYEYQTSFGLLHKKKLPSTTLLLQQ